MKTGHNYYMYIVQCSDGTYSTGVTNDLERRLWEHPEGYSKNCHTYTRRPVELKYSEHYHTISNAIAREKQLKGWSGKKKEALVIEDLNKIKELAKSGLRQTQPDTTPKDRK